MKVMQSAFKGLLVLLFLVGNLPQAFAVCTPTGFFKDGINLTAALINPRGTVTGDVDATGCNIGIFYSTGTRGRLEGASVHSANYYGVVNHGGTVDIRDSTIYDIGDTPFTGAQHGTGIHFTRYSHAQGDIEDNVIWNYQKDGIVVNGPSTANVRHNTVIGQGPVSFIAQNGIEFGFGATGRVSHNLVVGNSYTGTQQTASGGILLVGGPGYGGIPESEMEVEMNVAVGNDVGVWFTNLDENDDPVATPTNNRAKFNTIRNNAVQNTSGGGGGAGYQAGIFDEGEDDAIIGNSICGTGYTPVTPPPYLYAIDTTNTNSPIVKDNTTCDAIGPVTAPLSHARIKASPHR